MQLAFLDFEAAFDSLHRDRLLKALRADGVRGNDNWSETRGRAGFLFNFAVGDIMRRRVDQCPNNIGLALSKCPLTDLEYANYVVIFAESITKLQHVVNIVSKLAAAYELRLRPDKCKQNAKYCMLKNNAEMRQEYFCIQILNEILLVELHH
ncbi:hypothetical protein RB195_013772 [Necator americanus]|uniref:Reverse transcriptase domain-containing protein n=1 Tax=Necator americanus TaxID=51031 RepID=A0ABR1DXQ4_NECAM